MAGRTGKYVTVD